MLEQLIDEETAGSNSNSTVSSLVIIGEDEEVKDVYELAQENGVGAVSWREIEALGDASLIGPGKEVGEKEVLMTRFWEDAEGVRSALLVISHAESRIDTLSLLAVPAEGPRVIHHPPSSHSRYRRPPLPLPSPQTTLPDLERRRRLVHPAERAGRTEFGVG